MKTGPEISNFEARFVPAREIRARLQEAPSPLISVLVPRDSTARVYTTCKGGCLGIIASESEPFYEDCSRLRLSATGTLRPCIMMNTGVLMRAASTPKIIRKP